MMIGVTVSLLAVTSAPASATTATPPTPALAPATPTASGYFDYTLTPRQSVEGSVRIRNPGTEAASFVLYATDASTSTATGVIYGGFSDPLKATGRWITPATKLITLAAGESQIIPFQVTVPPATAPGDYVAGFSVKNPQAVPQTTTTDNISVALKVSTRVIVAVVVHVPGPAPLTMRFGPPTITALNGAQQVVTLPIEGTGGPLAKPNLVATLSDCANGPALATLRRHLDTFVPRTAIAYSWPLGQRVLTAGCYKISAILTEMGNTVATEASEVQVTEAVAKITLVAAPAGKQPAGAPPVTSPPVAAVALAAVLIVAGAALAVTVVRGRQAKLLRRPESGRRRAGRHSGSKPAGGHAR